MGDQRAAAGERNRWPLGAGRRFRFAIARSPVPPRMGCLRKGRRLNPLPRSSSPADRVRHASSQESRVSGPEGRGQSPPTLTARVSGTTIMARMGAGGFIDYVSTSITLRSSPRSVICLTFLGHSPEGARDLTRLAGTRLHDGQS